MNRRNMSRGLLGGMMDVVHGSRSSERIEVGGSTLDVFIDSDRFATGRTAHLDWVTRSAKAVTPYFGRFPVANARLDMAVSQNGRVSNGVSYGEGGAHCRISVGQYTTVEDLYNDCELTHEMVHFSFPSVADHHHWIEEGIATYVEPIARASIGVLTADQVWGEMMRDMPQGQPEVGDRGLDRTHTWRRTYWGGALFCLQADVEIRKRTGNAKGLQDALRAINRADGTIEAYWPLARALYIGDHATDTRMLTERLRQTDCTARYRGLDFWEQLGVRRTSQGIALVDRAPCAAIRAGICGSANRKG